MEESLFCLFVFINYFHHPSASFLLSIPLSFVVLCDHFCYFESILLGYLLFTFLLLLLLLKLKYTFIIDVIIIFYCWCHCRWWCFIIVIIVLYIVNE